MYWTYLYQIYAKGIFFMDVEILDNRAYTQTKIHHKGGNNVSELNKLLC